MNENDSGNTKTVDVTVVYTPDGSGNSGNGRFNVTCVKQSIVVHNKNTDIIYQMTSDTPADIIFTGFTAYPNDQLGAAVITNNGRTMTTVDAMTSTAKEKIAVTLLFAETFSFDPEVTNEPKV